jgi:ABC-type amino acid transport substrate-binding protein
MVWMIASIVTIAVFTASVTSVLTIRHLQGEVHEVSDLSSVRVGAVAGTSTEDALTHLRIAYRTFATPQDGLKALRSHTIDAFVYDKPLLAWLIRQNFSSSIDLLDKTFDVQDYAFALPGDSPLRKSVNVAVLDARRSEWWDQTTFQYLGTK